MHAMQTKCSLKRFSNMLFLFCMVIWPFSFLFKKNKLVWVSPANVDFSGKNSTSPWGLVRFLLCLLPALVIHWNWRMKTKEVIQREIHPRAEGLWGLKWDLSGVLTLCYSAVLRWISLIPSLPSTGPFPIVHVMAFLSNPVLNVPSNGTSTPLLGESIPQSDRSPWKFSW